MNGKEVVELARRTYLEELARFVMAQAGNFPRGLAEAATARPENQALFRGGYRVDFVGQTEEGAMVPLDVVAKRRLEIPSPREGLAGSLKVRIEALSWDDVEISHDATGDLLGALGPWFETWFDPTDKRRPADPGRPADVIHWVGIGDNMLLVDFGSAPPSAFWALVEVLRAAGATSITIRQSPAAA